MTFIIKNVRSHAVVVDGVSINPGQQLTFHTIDPASEVNAALDRGDLTLTMETPGDHIDLQPFHSGDPAIDGK